MVASIYYGETGWEGTVVECPQQHQVTTEEAANSETMQLETVLIAEAESSQDIVTESVDDAEEKAEEQTEVNPTALQGSILQ